MQQNSRSHGLFRRGGLIPPNKSPNTPKDDSGQLMMMMMMRRVMRRNASGGGKNGTHDHFFVKKKRKLSAAALASWLRVCLLPHFCFGHQIYRIGILGCVLSSLGPWCKGWVAA